MFHIFPSIHEKYFIEFIYSILIFNSKTLNLNYQKLIHFQNKNSNENEDKIIIFNTEQLSIPEWYQNIFNLSLKYPILDYSEENIKLIKNFNLNSNCILFPILFDKNKCLFNYKLENCIYDIGFIGCLTDRRIKILNQLLNLNYKIHFIENIYDFEEKYKEIFKCKILLNLHAFDNYKIFEFARCSIPVFNSQIIISENSLDNVENSSGLNKIILSKINFCSYDDIVNNTIEILNNTEKSKYEINIKELEEETDKEIERINKFF